MIICLCHKVSDRDIARETASGCRDFDSLQQETGVATACGACLDCAQDTFSACCQARACAPAPKTAPTSAAARPVSAAVRSFRDAVPA